MIELVGRPRRLNRLLRTDLHATAWARDTLVFEPYVVWLGTVICATPEPRWGVVDD